MAENNNNGASEIKETLNQSEAFILKYKKAIICGVSVAVVAVLACLFWNTYSDKQQVKASTEMAKAQEYYGMAVQGDMPELFKMALEGDSLGHAGFKTIADDYSSTKAGNLANLYAGICCARLGQLDEAAEYFDEFDSEDDQMISPSAKAAVGNIEASQNNLDDAVKTLVKAADMADNNTLSPGFLIQAGEILESQGKKAEALELYQRIKDNYYQWVKYSTIDAYIERVKE